ncbi:hypothetical protein K490DRAFT_48164 [Saccharata proteae CBS 121410]|uniref:Alpha/beta-hydrolase n=1 Tax=Saccharata proteae CBS 121410 TaxID=1314787 RepID=A0A9P4HQP8_9PEZI|nr:hypothetical protein K490DRAFT_48164 [Saccharata proteae CBS 121410]
MPNALADIHYNAMTAPDQSSPSEDETTPPHEYRTEDAESLVGVSIGHAQSHFISPTTPAAEKAAALDDEGAGGLFGSSRTTVEEAADMKTPTFFKKKRSSKSRSPKRDGKDEGTDSSPERLPSPWRAGPKKFHRSDDLKATLRESFGGNRRRASSGGSATDGIKKLLPSFTMPSMPKSPNLLNLSFSHSSEKHSSDNEHGSKHSSSSRPKRSQTLGSDALSKPTRRPSSRDPKPKDKTAQSRRSTIQYDGTKPPEALEKEASQEIPADTNGLGIQNTDVDHLSAQRSEDRRLRRSTSDQSLLLQNTLSRASSLGDDSRFEHVQEQVNSRLKAIKDSWQDSNFKLPGMPSMPNIPSMTNFGFGSSLTDLTRGRNGSIGNRNGSPATSGSRKPPPSALNLNGTSDTHKAPATAGMSSSSAANHPNFAQAAQELTGDVVILGGYRGSILRSAEPPHRQLWVPIKVGLNLRKVDLEVGLNPEDEENMEERVIPGGMLTHIGPVDIARRLFKRLRASENARSGKLRVHDYGYDWRLSPHLLSRKLIAFLEKLPCNQPGVPREKRGATVIAHSLGGLITRHAINQRPELFAGVIYAGVPKTCVNILGPLRNGDDVLLSSRVLTAQVNFTIRTSFALLPLSGKCFFDRRTKEEYDVDFFDPKTWVDCRLSPCVAPPLPPLNNPPITGISGIMNSMASVLPSMPMIGRKGSISKSSSSTSLFSLPGTSNNNTSTNSTNGTTTTTTKPPHTNSLNTEKSRDASAAATHNATTAASGGAQNSGMAPQLGGNNASNPAEHNHSVNSTVSTAVTIPQPAALAYLTRTLAAVKRFKQELAFNPSHAEKNLYPPAAVIYGKSTPTVYGARVDGREGIKHADAYDELAFASGDGVVLARAAMVPEGYSVVRGGVVSSDRGHVTLLGDLEAVGRCLNAVNLARSRGVGCGGEE